MAKGENKTREKGTLLLFSVKDDDVTGYIMPEALNFSGINRL